MAGHLDSNHDLEAQAPSAIDDSYRIASNSGSGNKCNSSANRNNHWQGALRPSTTRSARQMEHAGSLELDLLTSLPPPSPSSTTSTARSASKGGGLVCLSATPHACLSGSNHNAGQQQRMSRPAARKSCPQRQTPSTISTSRQQSRQRHVQKSSWPVVPGA